MTDPAGAVLAPRSAATARSPRARWLAAVSAMLMCLGLIALGTWQLYRLQWKLALIERVDSRVHAAASAAPPPASWPAISRDADEYLHVRLHGHYMAGADTLVQAATELGGGFWLLSPFCSDDGSIVLVNRGFVTPARPKPALAATPPRCAAAAAAPPASESGPGVSETVTGLLRLSEPDGGFLRHNDAAANRWYSRDVAAIARARGLAPATAVAPYFIDRAATPAPAGAAGDAPVGGLTVIHFNNNHLVYALTWYGLALLAAAGAWLLLRRREGDGEPAAATDAAAGGAVDRQP